LEETLFVHVKLEALPIISFITKLFGNQKKIKEKAAGLARLHGWKTCAIDSPMKTASKEFPFMRS
jgi:hypothetical protein